MEVPASELETDTTDEELSPRLPQIPMRDVEINQFRADRQAPRGRCAPRVSAVIGVWVPSPVNRQGQQAGGLHDKLSLDLRPGMAGIRVLSRKSGSRIARTPGLENILGLRDPEDHHVKGPGFASLLVVRRQPVNEGKGDEIGRASCRERV